MTVENNLMLFNTENYLYGPFMVKGGVRDITFRANTVVGHLARGGSAFGMRLNKEGSNPNMEDVVFYNNIWSDPTGGMADFSDGTPDYVDGEALGNNLYYNGGRALPDNDGWRLFIPQTDDPAGVFADPKLPNPKAMTISRWDPEAAQFLSGETTIEGEFRRLVEAYAKLPDGSAAIDAANPDRMPAEDILGRRWVGTPDIGAYQTEVASAPRAGRRDLRLLPNHQHLKILRRQRILAAVGAEAAAVDDDLGEANFLDEAGDFGGRIETLGAFDGLFGAPVVREGHGRIPAEGHQVEAAAIGDAGDLVFVQELLDVTK